MRLFPIAAALTLAACGTTQSPQYFILPDSQYIRPAAQGSEIEVKVNLADPLANGGESAVLFCFVFLYLAAAGGGSLALDNLFGKNKS